MAKSEFSIFFLKTFSKTGFVAGITNLNYLRVPRSIGPNLFLETGTRQARARHEGDILNKTIN